MLGFGLHRYGNVSRLLKPCSRWGSNSQPRHCSAAYCLISTARWPIAPLELLTQKHFTKHYGLCVVIFQFIPWTFLKLITAIWYFMLGFGLLRKLNVSRLLKPCSRWGSNSQPRHCSAAYCLISTTRWSLHLFYELSSNLLHNLIFKWSFYVRLWTPSLRKCLSPSKNLLQVHWSTARWPIAPLELLTQKHFTKHYGLWEQGSFNRTCELHWNWL